MDHESLRTASSYLNNLLLARGLLRHAEPLDFVKPSRDSRAAIINLVHDLVLREDRDRDQREHLAVTLRRLRAEDAHKAAEIDRLKTRAEESARAAVAAQTGERAARDEVKRVEKAVKSLHEHMAKMKTALAQVRTQCANDVRKRDLELARLKTHLQGQQRGNKAGAAAPSISITGGSRRQGVDTTLHDLGDPEYSLKQETTEFLTSLSQSLSDENDGLITLIRGSLATVRELLGLPAVQTRHADSAIGSLDSESGKPSPVARQTNAATTTTNSNSMLHALPTSYETLAADMDATLAHLKTVLTNPNFVSVDEVELRDEEIARLREGWERMEMRWKEVLAMMEGWRRRVDTGDTINIEDLRRGLGLVSPVRRDGDRVGLSALVEESEVSFANGEASEIRVPGTTDERGARSSFALEPAVPSRSAACSPKRKRDLLDPPEFFDLRPSTQRSAAPLPPPPRYFEAEAAGEDDAEAGHDNDENSVEPQMTVAEKLAVARAAAEEAAARRRLNPSSPTKSSSRRPGSARDNFGLDGVAPTPDAERDDTLGKLLPPTPAGANAVRKTKIRGRPKRRKSTLSPEELEDLMMGAERG